MRQLATTNKIGLIFSIVMLALMFACSLVSGAVTQSDIVAAIYSLPWLTSFLRAVIATALIICPFILLFSLHSKKRDALLKAFAVALITLAIAVFFLVAQGV